MLMSAQRCWMPAAVAVGLGMLIGCGAQAPAKPEAPKSAPKSGATPKYEETAMPTVPPSTPTTESEAEATPVPTPAPAAKREGEAKQAIGPIITYFGVARADGMVVNPNSTDSSGVPTFHTAAGSGFMLVVEAKPGISGIDVSRQISMYSPTDPKLRPDLEIISNRDLGDGSKEVCDRRKPKIGGVPGINPPTFAVTQKVSDAMNDLACRFETFVESDSSCTVDKLGNFSFANPETKSQFCTIVARSYLFPEGTTELQVRVRDTAGNPGPIKKLRVLRRPPQPTAQKAPAQIKVKKK